MQNLHLLIFYYFAAYFIVTLIGICHTIFNIKVRKMKSMLESSGMGEAYEKTKPWHPLYNLIIFPIFAYFYLISLSPLAFSDVILASFAWGISTIIIDLFGWILIKHPWSLSFKEFYLDYQPWITLIYLTIFASPFIAYLFIAQ